MKQFGMFAKYWQPGQVKTRLAAAIGEALAADFHRISVSLLAKRFAAVADRNLLSVAPADRIDEFTQVVGESWEVVAQSEGDLGDRMANYFRQSFISGADCVVLIGSDSPDLPSQYVRTAFEQLKSHEVVLGPTDDGGYYLVGARGTVPPIFDSIPWSTGEVFSQTVRCLNEENVSWFELPRWYDVDDIEDFRRFAVDLDEASGNEWKPMKLLLAQVDLE